MFKGIFVDFKMRYIIAHCDNIGTSLQVVNFKFINMLDLGVYSKVYYACINSSDGNDDV